MTSYATLQLRKGHHELSTKSIMISTRTIIFIFCFVLNVFFQSVFSTAGTLKVKDAVNSKLYHGPKNPRRSDLSSYILRSPKYSSSTQKPPKYFTGSPKPVWDEPPGRYIAPIYHTITCNQGSICSHTIPLWRDYEDEENSVYDSPSKARLKKNHYKFSSILHNLWKVIIAELG